MSNARVHQVWKWLQWKFNTKTACKVLYGRKIINALFAGLGRSVLGKTVPWVLSTQDLWHSFPQYGPLGRQITYFYLLYSSLSYVKKHKSCTPKMARNCFQFTLVQIKICQGAILFSRAPSRPLLPWTREETFHWTTLRLLVFLDKHVFQRFNWHSGTSSRLLFNQGRKQKWSCVFFVCIFVTTYTF